MEGVKISPNSSVDWGDFEQSSHESSDELDEKIEKKVE